MHKNHAGPSHRRAAKRPMMVSAAALLVAVALFTTACESGPTTLRGTLTVAGAPAPPNVVVSAYSDAGDTLVAQARTDSAGHYAFAASTLPAGTYRVRFGDGSWWEGATNWADAQPLSVSDDPTTRLDATIEAPSAEISGTVTSRHGRPIAGATVTATTSDGDDVLATATTAADGTYALGGLSAAPYALHVTAPTFGEQWLGGTATAGASTRIDLEPASSRSAIDVTLPPEAHLTGQLTGVPGAMDGVILVAYDKATGEAIGSAASAESYGYPNFSIGGLPAGTYTVGVVDTAKKLVTEVKGANGSDPIAGTGYTLGEGQSVSVGQMEVHGSDCPLDGRGSDLSGHDFSHANLANCDFVAATLTGAHFDGADLTNAALSSAHAHGADFTGADLDGAKFFVTDASAATFTGASMTGTTFQAASLSGADFGGSQLGKVRSGQVVGTPVGLGAGWTATGGYLIGPGADLSGANLSGVDLSGRDLSQVKLTNANLTSADLAGADLSSATLLYTNLTGTNLSGTDLTQAYVVAVTSGGIVGEPAALPAGAVLFGGALFSQQAVVNGVDIEGADLSGAVLDGASITGITGTPAALPAHWALAGAFLIGPGATITGADIDGLDLSDVGLHGIRTGGLTGTPSALPTGWLLYNGYLVGPGAQLGDAQLAGLVAPGIDVSNDNLNGADLSGADLSGANLHGVHLGNANLADADFSQADLTGADIGGSNLTGTILGTATLTGVVSRTITGTPASLPAGVPLVNGYLLCRAANISYANLSGADLSGLDLSGAYLAMATLDSANLTGTDLSGAQLGGVSFAGTTVTGADLSGTVLGGSTSSGLVGTPAALPTGWVVIGGELVPPNG
jgi:uncharacterized protein YjbI with pentapeptide repeats